jgi:hypothetical protein
MALSLTPYFNPIFVKGVERINYFNSSLVIFSSILLLFLFSQDKHRVADLLIIVPQSRHLCSFRVFTLIFLYPVVSSY